MFLSAFRLNLQRTVFFLENRYWSGTLMVSHFSKTRTVIYWGVLLYSVLFIPYCHWEIASYSGGCMDGNLLGLLVFCYFATLFISAVGLIDTLALIFRSVRDRVSPPFFFRAFPINFGLLALMWFFMKVCLL